ncbi:MAG: hypothetical protein KDH09_11300 [Chrysiogenetes bacterium]|nr:hypothetical protein [Chrysiogenetes bacterium]
MMAIAAFPVALAVFFVLYAQALSSITDTDKIDKFRASIDAHLDDFLADRNFVRRKGVFPEYGNEHDAGPFLNPRLRWQDPDGEYDDYLPPQAPEDQWIILPESLETFLDECEVGEWTQRLDELAAMEVDTSWIGKLSGFDHWELLRSSPAAALLGEDPDVGQVSIPHPRWSALTGQARVHLARGVINGRLREALAETRHLAMLAYSTETLIGATIASAELGFEARLHDSLAAREALPEFEWKVLDEAQRFQIRRYVFSMEKLFSLWTPPDVLAKIFVPGSPAVCSALMKGIDSAASARKFFEPRFPFESDYRPAYALLDRVVSRVGADCRLTHLRERWERAAADPYSVRYPFSEKHDVDRFNGMLLPYVRRDFGITYFQPYSEAFSIYKPDS